MNEPETYKIPQAEPPQRTEPPASEAPPKKKKPDPPKPERFISLDAYRGFIMLMLAASGFGIFNMLRPPDEDATDAQIAGWESRWRIVDRGKWEWVGHHFDHPKWQSNFAFGQHDATEGSPWLRFCVSFWDLIQPAFMFMVGVAMPFSFENRKRAGQTEKYMLWHAFIRAVVLTLLGVFLQSLSSPRTNWIFPNVLSQIGLGYFFVYLLLNRTKAVQIGAFVGILLLTWGAFVVYQTPDSYDPAAVSASAEKGEVLEGFFGHWTKNGNVASAFDSWFLPLFPPAKDPPVIAESEEASTGEAPKAAVVKYEANYGGYTTLNFVPSMATILLGVFCGQLLMTDKSSGRKLLELLAIAAGCLVIGVAAGATCCPIIKRIWTPSWALFSGGYVVAMLALFYMVFDMWGLKKVALPLTVIGTNSLAFYLMGQMLRPWLVNKVFQIHLGESLNALLGFIAEKANLLARLGATPDTAGQAMYHTFQPIIDPTAAFLL
ncbi:MAG: hypothetical protein KDA66_15480, partial [Planctomycetaceae bacterium]|nr:hypothetical protein [Planctomycetaceae bacterium]